MIVAKYYSLKLWQFHSNISLSITTNAALACVVDMFVARGSTCLDFTNTFYDPMDRIQYRKKQRFGAPSVRPTKSRSKNGTFSMHLLVLNSESV